jgi:hypothetical protein
MRCPAPRHRRGSVFDDAGIIRRALARPLPLGLERALDSLVDSRSRSADWLAAAASLVRHASESSRAPSSGASHCRVLIVFGVGLPEVR